MRCGPLFAPEAEIFLHGTVREAEKNRLLHSTHGCQCQLGTTKMSFGPHGNVLAITVRPSPSTTAYTCHRWSDNRRT